MMGARSARPLWLLAVGAVLVSLRGEDKPTDFVRFVEGEKGEGKLETAIVTYSGEGGVEVDLIAAVHVADAEYYRGLQRRFERYDRLLYEMVKPKDADPAAKEKGKPDNLLSFFQRGLKGVLGLEFQLDAVDYSKRNFVHADLDPETFFRLQKEKGESILGLLWKSMLKDFERQSKGEKQPIGLLELVAAFTSRDSERKLKLLFARELEDMEKLLAGFEEGTDGGSVIVAERNKVVVKALRDGMAAGKKKLGVFYGGGHMPDLEKRLAGELGLKKSKEAWVTAWDIRRKEGEASAPVEPRESPREEPQGKAQDKAPKASERPAEKAAASVR